jgi:hypothetical protein
MFLCILNNLKLTAVTVRKSQKNRWIQRLIDSPFISKIIFVAFAATPAGKTKQNMLNKLRMSPPL